MTKTNKGLVAYATSQLGKPYWYGCFGQKSTKELYNSKKKQYPSQYQWNCPSNQLNIKVHDCVGLIKGYLWCDTNESTPKYNASQDVSADGMLTKCKEKGAISTMPDIPGILVFLPGHIGVYIGDGYVIEAKGHAYGVVKTKLQGRGWKNWGKCPWITYEGSATKPTTVTKPKTSTTSTSSNSKIPTYKVGTVLTLQVNLKVRTGAGTNYSQKKRSQLTADGQKHAQAGTYAVLLKGTRVTLLETKKVGNDIWGRCPSGWIALYYKGDTYAK